MDWPECITETSWCVAWRLSTTGFRWSHIAAGHLLFDGDIMLEQVGSWFPPTYRTACSLLGRTSKVCCLSLLLGWTQTRGLVNTATQKNIFQIKGKQTQDCRNTKYVVLSFISVINAKVMMLNWDIWKLLYCKETHFSKKYNSCFNLFCSTLLRKWIHELMGLKKGVLVVLFKLKNLEGSLGDLKGTDFKEPPSLWEHVDGAHSSPLFKR